MIKEKMLGELNSRQEEALDKVMSRSSDLLRMINSILEATSIESGRVELECREVNLKSLLDELKALYEMPLEKAITFVWDTPEEAVTIKTDFVKVKHILQNLINNAIEFTEKGQVTIAIRYLPESKNVQFKVSDTGNGIPPETLSTVFELFRQGDSSGARSHGGVGLGLYIVKKYTEVLGGAVEVETEPGKGSTFTVTIPSGMAAH
jgi:signal transduction histidine kinase